MDEVYRYFTVGKFKGSNKIYGIEKDAEGNHLLMKYEIRECGMWPNYYKALDDEQECGKTDE